MAGQLEIGGRGELGLAFEAAYPSTTFTAPTVWLPIRSESIARVEDNQYRMNIRGLADRQNPLQGYTHVEGEVEFEVTSDRLLHMLYGMRATIAISGTTSPFTYTFTPSAVTKPTTAASGTTTPRTLCLTVRRGGEYFGYYGCSVSRARFFIADSILMCNMSIFGIDEATPGAQTASYPTSQPFSAGKNSVLLSASPITTVARTDVDTLTIEINDNAVNEQRIKSGTGPAYIRWGEREVSGNVGMDFTDRAAEYAAFTGQTKYAVTLTGQNSATTDSVSVSLAALSLDTFPIALNSIGDVVRAEADFHAYYDTALTDVYQIVVKTTQTIG
jgi:hypothetical protein